MSFRRHYILQQGLHACRSLVRSVLRLQYEIRVLQATNAAKPWERDFRLVCFLAGYSFLYCWGGLVWLKTKQGRSYNAGQLSSASLLTSDPGWALAR